ncbi:MAG: ribbon-helix-helix protein, CopG family [Nanoarchaeota archaeon]|nr:ribbon-helix-helix protein, CopG family [Nanoarchaeota archaeon]
MQLSKIKKILKENKEAFEILENYDKTHELPFQRKRIDITLSVETISKLKKLREKTGKPISHIIEEIVRKCQNQQHSKDI